MKILKNLFVAFIVLSGAQNVFAGESAATDEPGVWDKTKDVTSDVWKGTKDVASDVWDGTKQVTSDVWKGTKEVGSDIKDGITNDDKPHNTPTNTTSHQN